MMHLLSNIIVAGDLGLFSLSVFITFVGMLLVPFLRLRQRAYFTALVVTINAILTSIPALHILSGGAVSCILPGFFWFGDITLRIDPLAAWFLIIINITSVTGVLYGAGYMKKYNDQSSGISLHWVLYILFHTSMLWVCLVQNSIIFLII
jgi:hydrogenase-4 component B